MIKPELLSNLFKEIILANKKKEDGTGLEWSGPDRYKLLCGQDYRFVMKYKDGSPYVILDEQSDTEKPEVDQWQLDILNKLNDVSSFLNRSYNNRKCQGKEAVRFLITKQGLQLHYEDCKLVVNKDLNYETSSSSNPLGQDYANTLWIDNVNQKFEDVSLNTFVLMNGRSDLSNSL